MTGDGHGWTRDRITRALANLGDDTEPQPSAPTQPHGAPSLGPIDRSGSAQIGDPQ